MHTVAIIVGSLRRGSLARRIAEEVIPFFPEGFETRNVDIAHLPLYNFDYDGPSVASLRVPEPYLEFRRAIKESDGVLFVTPENNRTIPACLKNAVDVASKPTGDVAWKNLPAGIISHSIGRLGGYSAQKNLRLALSYFDMPMPGQPEVFLGGSHELLFPEGGFRNESTVEFLRDYVKRFAALVEQTASR